MTIPYADRERIHPAPRVVPRMLASMWRQARHSAACPDGPRLDGQRALVTGGARGIGLETTRGLAARGAEVIAASRGEARGKAAAEEVAREFAVPTHFLPLDLADLHAVTAALERLEALLDGRRLDVFVANAGLWPLRHRLSAQGHEIAYATNVLGHHALLQGAIERGLLAESARVVIVTGDIYILSDECTSDYAYRGALGGQLAYCRSKLGNLWQARELAKRQPSLRVHAVHPGVIASDLGGDGTGALGVMKRAFMLSTEQGAQTSLYCATQPDLPTGSYFHNVLGRVELHPEDPAASASRAAALWDRLEEQRRAAAA